MLESSRCGKSINDSMHSISSLACLEWNYWSIKQAHTRISFQVYRTIQYESFQGLFPCQVHPALNVIRVGKLVKYCKALYCVGAVHL
jgi:hypothetical protein